MSATTMKPKERQILQAKIDGKIKAGQRNSKGILDRIEKEGNLLTDFIAPLGSNAGANPVVQFHSNGKLTMKVAKEKFGMHPHAVTQAGGKLGIPTKYIRDLAYGEKWQRDLASTVLNEHSLNTNRSRVLLRSVGGEVRGVLSDSYRRLSTPDIYGAFIQAVNRQGAKIVDAHAVDTKTWMETLYPKVIPVPTKNNGVIGMVFGMRISNSDFGDGALDIRTFGMQVVCTNGMVGSNMLRQIHLGGKLPDNISLSDKTYKLDTQTQVSVIDDLVKQYYSMDSMMEQAKGIQKASVDVIDVEKEMLRLPSMGMLKAEVEMVNKVLVNSKPEDGLQGQPTLWKLTQAITAVGRDNEDARRKRELEEIGGKLMATIK